MYKIVLIDIDNTLLDFSLAEKKALSKTLTKFGVNPTLELINRFKEINEYLWKQFELKQINKEELLEKRFRDFFSNVLNNNNINAKEVNIYYLNELSSNSDLMPHAQETLSKLCECAKIYAVTNGVYKTQIKRISGANINKYLSDIFISEVVGIQKPEPGFFDFVFESIGFPDKKAVLLVGDSLSADIIGGIRYGIDTCWYNPKHLVGNLNPTYEILDLLELIQIVK